MTAPAKPLKCIVCGEHAPTGVEICDICNELDHQGFEDGLTDHTIDGTRHLGDDEEEDA